VEVKYALIWFILWLTMVACSIYQHYNYNHLKDQLARTDSTYLAEFRTDVDLIAKITNTAQNYKTMFRESQENLLNRDSIIAVRDKEIAGWKQGYRMLNRELNVMCAQIIWRRKHYSFLEPEFDDMPIDSIRRYILTVPDLIPMEGK